MKKKMRFDQRIPILGGELVYGVHLRRPPGRFLADAGPALGGALALEGAALSGAAVFALLSASLVAAPWCPKACVLPGCTPGTPPRRLKPLRSAFGIQRSGSAACPGVAFVAGRFFLLFFFFLFFAIASDLPLPAPPAAGAVAAEMVAEEVPIAASASACAAADTAVGAARLNVGVGAVSSASALFDGVTFGRFLRNCSARPGSTLANASANVA